MQFGMTPLHIAADERNEAAVRELLRHNCDVSLRDEVGGQLHTAFVGGGC